MGPPVRQLHGTVVGVVSVGGVMFAGLVVGGQGRVGGDAGLLALAVGLAVEDEFVGGGLEPVDRDLGEERVGHQPSHSIGSRLEVTTVAAARWRSTISS